MRLLSTDTKEIKTHILQRVREFPHQSKNFYLKQLSISFKRFIEIVDEMIQDGSLIQCNDIQFKQRFYCKYKPKTNVKYLIEV